MNKVIDAMPSTGKTLRMIKFINEHPEKKWLFLTPYLLETHRISGVKYKTINGDIIPIQDPHTHEFIYEDHNQTYNCVDSQFKHPVTGWKGKLNSLLKYIRNDDNIVGTHKLYMMMTKDIYNEIKSRGYTLIIDETLDVIDKFTGGMRAKQLITLWEDGFIYREEGTCNVRWREHDAHLSPEDSLAPMIKRLADSGNLISPDVNNRLNIIFWTFPADFIRCFTDVFILTHNFEGSLMHKYFQKHKVGYTIE